MKFLLLLCYKNVFHLASFFGSRVWNFPPKTADYLVPRTSLPRPSYLVSLYTPDRGHKCHGRGRPSPARRISIAAVAVVQFQSDVETQHGELNEGKELHINRDPPQEWFVNCPNIREELHPVAFCERETPHHPWGVNGKRTVMKRDERKEEGRPPSFFIVRQGESSMRLMTRQRSLP